ncbi:MAG: 3-dehydroquinate synthase [Candidatus Levybacteria bacterium RIFCSPHIGHO2_12_FULL_38_12]|nr:MAG: 3-dehydroquinate synthase [Candidatus Levybacteria bacterium RIFCSPHIGHO2_01_FULL_38_12]OGH21785.1 MAG: 3-dehydroquinate synthase [Candidatus Levybacteria bacterium RIFCSPHIGHO2_02_FULL_37_18]OGH22557.1 MAG: 3-dehydroquinate synthase [Candidatus Levybacteria bacterium RIFCSPHIGHO2_12_FULL_38_12]OGH33406.1 MAG: 3-dehydroquinate synthase [Candidatus Levybacteria bacterium RIFCSPLOWO2_01_FULL_37_20]OGH44095.1 MAG: 3-dehydroquinate synthase [Candidatus Levybacteria bacterium RIFCSPLOWO2_02_
MRKIQINIASDKKSYPIFVGSGILDAITKFDLYSYSKIVVITDTHIENLFLKKIVPYFPQNISTIIIPCGERAKSITCILEIWRQLLEIGCDRKSLVINIGGGVIGDMGGFAASTFMRGLDFLQIPTTLLAQVDSSIGGKTGINFLGVKNLIGVFRQPIGVMCDVSVLESLSDRILTEGFGEVIKHGAIADRSYFNFVTSKKPKEFSQKELSKVVSGSIEIKKCIVEEDVTEKDRRRLVNFGHTIGHALESLSLESGSPLLHGEAVSIGMIAEGKISVLKNILKQEDLETITKALEHAGLPTKAQNIDHKKVMEKIKSDKKSERGIVYFTLLSGIGTCQTGQEVSDQNIKKALEFVAS